MFYGLGGAVEIYLLINIAFLHVLPLSTLAGSKLAAGTVANAILGAGGERIVQLLVIRGPLPSAVNACTLLMASRTLFSMSRDGLGIPVAARVNPKGTPVARGRDWAIITIGFLATGTFETMIAIAAFFFVANYSYCPSSV